MVCPAQLRAATLNSKAQMFTKKIVVENVLCSIRMRRTKHNYKELSGKKSSPRTRRNSVKKANLETPLKSACFGPVYLVVNGQVTP
jgi:hypothetical protein